MKIPKKFNTDATGAAPLVEKTTEIIKPIKLKIKTQDMVTIASSVKVENDGDDDVPDAEDESDSESEIRNEDDVLMNELKNSYQDNDFVYPSLKSCGTTLRTSKKLHKSETPALPKLESFTTTSNEKSDNKEITDEKSQSRKRKLKPHAAQYLEPKQERKPASDLLLPDSEPASSDPDEQSNSSDTVPPKNRLEKMIEKNLDSAIKEKPGSDTMKTNSDDDFIVEDEDDLDYEQEFKIKVKQNLKLSKKLKTKSVKHQKKLDSQELADAGSTARTTDPTSKSTAQLNKKSKKKGYATTKQRLGKLLKLNRLVNI